MPPGQLASSLECLFVVVVLSSLSYSQVLFSVLFLLSLFPLESLLGLSVALEFLFPTLILPILLDSSLSSVSGLKETLLAETDVLTSYSHRVFSAWNFGLHGEVHVRLRQRVILYELQVRSGRRGCNWL